ncbi:bifunctional transcriptional activator/DNA repair protein Ada [Pacificimonas sp. WHA3]|uniref:Bifunctional transcriptional activator/DNA repair protein Ada n=1 Tax=Pacificimonas pallii TaxID=2827236 RepID=A0ABS6SHE2_9SPHN|nr:trifunctional transcriptional activator/DNA repair protein Ada/methylated-DNA--[protein]-cysteine S-methyltransferase [Pacificimonas pallii]MBV7257670.1 bifunctional transcriptional activator/DNA repair protein Ada [Pacificimonas pallii]
MLLTEFDDDTLYQALTDRDPAFEGKAWVCVTSTGIFCRLTCPARNPLRKNVIFETSLQACVDSGFRPCKRCRPLDAPDHPVIGPLLRMLDSEPQRRWREDDVVELGLDPSTIRRVFRRHFGMTFLQVARARRLGSAAGKLAAEEKVIDAQLDAGYESGSGFRAAIKKILGTPPTRFRGQGVLSADWIETPIGPMLAIADEHVLHLLEFNDRKTLPAEIERLRERQGKPVIMARTEPHKRIAECLADYFAGTAGLPPLPVGDHGTAFQKSVWAELVRIPLGETRSYAGLAKALGNTGAVRAVARANGANQLALLFPCHRVIGSDGSLTGYAGGLWRKKWLLQHEQRMAAKG